MKLFLPLGLAIATIAPVANAQSITSQFKTELATKLGNKTGAAAKAAAQTIAKYVVKKRGSRFDPSQLGGKERNLHC